MTEPSMTEQEIRAILYPLRSGKPKVKHCPSKGTKKSRKPVPAKGKTSWGRIYADGREVCDDSAAGRREYAGRTTRVAQRQNWVCGCGCQRWMSETYGTPSYRTFQHVNLRGGGKQDDRIVDEKGQPMNLAYRWDCNGDQGSKRL